MSWGQHAILVSGVSLKNTKDEILKAFEDDNGEPIQVHLRGPTSAFVVFSDPSHVKPAIDKHHDQPLLDRMKKVTVVSADTTEMNSELVMLQNLQAQAGSQESPAAMDQPNKSNSAPHHTNLRVSTFSGDGLKGEVTYDQFRREVTTLMRQNLSSDAILNALTRSLRGTAAEILLSLGQSESGSVELQELFTEFDCSFGNVLPAETLFESFFSAKQQEGEKITVWSSRLKELMRRLQRSGQKLPEETARNVLRSKFWSGLQDSAVRGALRHKYEEDHSYEKLLIAARTAEMEFNPDPIPQKKADVHQMTASDSMEQKMDLLLSKFGDMESRLKHLERAGSRPVRQDIPDGQQPTPDSNRKPYCHYCKRPGHYKSECVILNAKQSAPKGK